MKYTLDLDTESSELARRTLLYLHRDDAHLPGLIRDAILTGLLSRWLDADMTTPCLAGVRAEKLLRDDLSASGTIVEISLGARAKGDDAPDRALATAQAIAGDMATTVERVLIAAARVGLRKLQPPPLPPVDENDSKEIAS